MNHAEVLAAAKRMADAAVPYVGKAKAWELANGVAGSAAAGDDVYQTCVDAILHRVACGWLSVGCVSDLAQDMARAWRNNQ